MQKQKNHLIIGSIVLIILLIVFLIPIESYPIEFPAKIQVLEHEKNIDLQNQKEEKGTLNFGGISSGFKVEKFIDLNKRYKMFNEYKSMTDSLSKEIRDFSKDIENMKIRLAGYPTSEKIDNLFSEEQKQKEIILESLNETKEEIANIYQNFKTLGPDRIKRLFKKIAEYEKTNKELKKELKNIKQVYP